MNPQQVAHPRSSANGFTRRRSEKEMGTRLENKSQPGKSNFNRMTISGGVESPSRERLVYLTTCLIGHQVEVQVIDGSMFSGIFHATNAEKDFGIILKMAHVTKTGGQKNISDSFQKPPSKTLIIPSKDLVQIVAKSVSVTRDGLMNQEVHDIMIDSSISQSRHVDLERELEPWVPDDDNPECPNLDNTFDSHWNRGWDQFEANATLFGVKSTFNEEIYTTKLDRGGPQMRELEREALRIAREIEGEDTHDLHLAEERGIRFHGKFDLDEETKYSSVFRGVDENEEILDSQNCETFGSEVTSSFSTLVEAESCDLSTSNDFHPSGSLDDQTQASASEESTHRSNKESTEPGLNATATAYAPSKSQEALEGVKMQHGATRARPGSSTSSTSECGNSTPTPTSTHAAATSSGLSPTSSMGSLTSEKSTLNPHAKEFRLNPNAKRFVPAAAASRVSDGSFYYQANVAPVPHMPLGIGMGMGPAFPGQQPVMYGPQTYFPSNGQQMFLGQPRQVVYMPTYPPEMAYKGREF